MEKVMSFDEFTITEVDNTEAMSDATWFLGLGVGVLVGIAAC